MRVEDKDCAFGLFCHSVQLWNNLELSSGTTIAMADQ